MRHRVWPRFAVVLAVLIAVSLSGCAVQKRVRSNTLDFLYPKGAEAAPPADVTLQLPVRVGLAFSPSGGGYQDSFTESQKQRLLERIAAAFRDRESIQAVEVVPSDFLSPGGGFANVDRLRVAFGLDLVVLVSYDQFQFNTSTKRAWTYWTIVGAYLVRGEKNETRTVLNAAVYDIPSRALLFHAAGESVVGGRATPVDVQRVMLERSEQGFSEATDGLIAQLDGALDAFQDQASSGTVRGPGTPALKIYDAAGAEVGAEGDGGGAFGAVEIALVGLLAFAAAGRRRAG